MVDRDPDARPRHTCGPASPAIADRIEELCEFDGLSPRENVLVFGRFSEPMRALRDRVQPEPDHLKHGIGDV